MKVHFKLISLLLVMTMSLSSVVPALANSSDGDAQARAEQLAKNLPKYLSVDVAKGALSFHATSASQLGINEEEFALVQEFFTSINRGESGITVVDQEGIVYTFGKSHTQIDESSLGITEWAATRTQGFTGYVDFNRKETAILKGPGQYWTAVILLTAADIAMGNILTALICSAIKDPKVCAAVRLVFFLLGAVNIVTGLVDRIRAMRPVQRAETITLEYRPTISWRWWPPRLTLFVVNLQAFANNRYIGGGLLWSYSLPKPPRD